MPMYESPSSKILSKYTKSSFQIHYSNQCQHIHPIISCKNVLNNHLKPSCNYTEQINIYCKYQWIKISLHLFNHLILIVNIIIMRIIGYIFQKITYKYAWKLYGLFECLQMLLTYLKKLLPTNTVLIIQY
eukprot:307976_1